MQVGYHNEHHDFPSVPWTRLPALRALAPEYYDTIASHPSWPMVIVNFIRDPEVGIFARAKRKGRGVPAVAVGAASPIVDGNGKGTQSEVETETEEREKEREKEKEEAALLVE